MKKIVSIAMAVLMCFLLVACGTAKKGYSEKDFLFYNKDGKIIDRPVESHNRIQLWLLEDENGMTYRQVAVGDDAITALEKYDLCYGKSIYYVEWTDEAQRLTKDVDLESLILSGEEITIYMWFDENFEAIDAMDDANYPPPYKLTFEICEGEIYDVEIEASYNVF
jgi:hypothetical protein